MALTYSVGPGTILRCDYSRGGFQEPEMVKARPAVVLSPRLPHRDSLCTIVPGLSISVGAGSRCSGAERSRSLPGSVSVASKRTRHFKSGRPRGERPDAAGVRHFRRQESIFVS